MIELDFHSQGQISHNFTADVTFDPLGAGLVWNDSVAQVTQSKKPYEVFLALSVTETGQQTEFLMVVESIATSVCCNRAPITISNKHLLSHWVY